MTATPKAPFPWFGGKSRVAEIVWRAFGDVPNYVEPFAGSLAVLLARPTPPHTETVNDLDCYLANFWRAIQADHEAVAHHADWPVNEADLEARHIWLVNHRAENRQRVKDDAAYFDAKVAGWWVWGLCQWIGSGWCRELDVHRKLPHLGDAGRGVHRQLPHLGDAGRGSSLVSYLGSLAARLRNVRVACGDWGRVVTDSVTWRHGITGVFLDPPYDDGAVDYAAGSRCSAEVREWAIASGDHPKMRIALCGLEGEHEMPKTWRMVPWKAAGGYSGQRRTDGTINRNPHRERVWFSPHCLTTERQRSLFAGAT